MLSTQVRLYSAFRIVIYHTIYHHADKLIFLKEYIIFFLDKWLKSLSRSVWLHYNEDVIARAPASCTKT